MSTAYEADLNFTSWIPARVVFGQGIVRDLGIELRRLGVERAILVTDKVLRDKTDVVAQAERALGARLAGVYDGVLPDTGVQIIDDGVALARTLGADSIVSVGGGSAIDTAKGMAICLKEGGSIRDHQGSMRLSRKQTPHVSIPTTAGTGAEVTPFIVVKDHATREKMHFQEDFAIPDCALLDPTLSVGMPPLLTAATGFDAIAHAVEAYTCLNRNPIADAAALQALRLAGDHLRRAVIDGNDRVARGQMLIASNLAGQAIATTGVGLVHAMAHVVGARYGVHHGTANAICLPHVVRFNQDELGERYRDLCAAVGLVATHEPGETLAGFLGDLLRELGLPTSLAAVGVPRDELPLCVQGSLSDAALVYNGKFAADESLLSGVYDNAFAGVS